MPTLDTVTDLVDITDESRYVGGYPYADFDALRDKDPVQWYRRPGFEPFWAVTGLAEVAYVSRHPELFSSAQRVTLDPPDAIEMIEADIDGRAEMFGHDRNDAPARSYMDAPRHRDLRRVMAPFFSVRAVATLEERFVELARAYADDFRAALEADGVADVATGLTNRLPVAAICEMVGGRARPRGRARLDRGPGGLRRSRAAASGRGRGRHLPAQHDGARRLSRRARARPDGAAGRRRHDRRARLGRGGGATTGLPRGALHRAEPLVAGNGTTRNAMAAGVRALLEHPTSSPRWRRTTACWTAPSRRSCAGRRSRSTSPGHV